KVCPLELPLQILQAPAGEEVLPEESLLAGPRDVRGERLPLEDAVRRRADEGPHDDCLELPHVPRPVVTLEEGERARTEAWRRPPHALCVEIEEVGHKERDVLAPLP